MDDQNEDDEEGTVTLYKYNIYYLLYFTYYTVYRYEYFCHPNCWIITALLRQLSKDIRSLDSFVYIITIYISDQIQDICSCKPLMNHECFLLGLLMVARV